MANIIENPKAYTGNELDTIFFRPMLTGPSAQDLGVKIIYNMPVPNTLNFWHRNGDVLKRYAKGWTGGALADKFQKTISLSKVKSEMGYSAQDYFSMIWEQITNSSDVNLDDLTGTELEQAETKLFQACIAESIRATMWLGDTTRDGSYMAFDGFIKNITGQLSEVGVTNDNQIRQIEMPDMSELDAAVELFETLYNTADDRLTAMKSEGNLKFYVTTDIYRNYEKTLESDTLESHTSALQNGRASLAWHGIPIIDVGISSYLTLLEDMPDSFALFTDSRNLALAVNTNSYPGTEIRMWYNPDEMENRQRAIFMAGTEALLPELMVASFKAKEVEEESEE
ncbi:MAG: hypothetical protein SNG69_08970 [Rikenellaceae bacterium]